MLLPSTTRRSSLEVVGGQLMQKFDGIVDKNNSLENATQPWNLGELY